MKAPCGDNENANPNVKKTNKTYMYGKHATMPVLASDLWAEVEVPTLKEFNPDDIKLDGTVVAVGKRRTGKTWCFRIIMYLLKDKLPAGIVISQTDELNKFWRDYVPKKYIFKKYNLNLVRWPLPWSPLLPLHITFLIPLCIRRSEPLPGKVGEASG